MLLAVNVGNSNVSFGIFDGMEMLRQGRVPFQDRQRLPDRIGAERFTQIALASVAPSKSDCVIPILSQAYSRPVLVAGRDLPYGIEIECDDPQKVGTDRLLNAVAAYAHTKSTTIAVDVGTAITVDLVSARGSFCGGAIAPGPGTMLRSLTKEAELLPDVSLERPRSPLGRNTVDAMRAGVYWGTIGVVEALVSGLAAKHSGTVPVLVTGGDGEWVTREISTPAEFVPALTLEGLAILVQNA